MDTKLPCTETRVDKFGAAIDVSPAEAALLRKIDRYMMVRPRSRKVTRLTWRVANSLAHVFSQFLGPQCHDQREAEWLGQRSWDEGNRV